MTRKNDTKTKREWLTKNMEIQKINQSKNPDISEKYSFRNR